MRRVLQKATYMADVTFQSEMSEKPNLLMELLRM
jgi:hypothetical protein